MRFVVTQIDQESHQPQGLFGAAYKVLNRDDLSVDEEQQLRILVNWFEKNLPVPRNPEITERAVFWYLASSRACIRRMWELTNLLRSHDYGVQVLKCRQLGNIVYRDRHQVAAYASERDDRVTIK